VLTWRLMMFLSIHLRSVRDLRNICCAKYETRTIFPRALASKESPTRFYLSIMERWTNHGLLLKDGHRICCSAGTGLAATRQARWNPIFGGPLDRGGGPA
jgi:hypothetical protein